MGHHHHHDHTHAPESFNKSFSIAITLNLLFVFGQVFYAFLAESMSLMADAVHNFGDVFGLMLAWGANWLLTRPARKRYSYGFKKTTVLAALTNALILVATSALIIYESIYKLVHLSEINEQIVIVVALIGIFINGGTALLFMKGAHHDLNIKSAFLHLMGDALISIGVVISAILIYFTHWLWLDPMMGLLIVAIILYGTWGLLRDSVRLILDAIPRHIDHEGIRNYFLHLPGVKSIHDLHIWGLSTKEVALTAHLIIPEGNLSDDEYKKINTDLKSKFKVDHVTIQVETGHISSCVRDRMC